MADASDCLRRDVVIFIPGLFQDSDGTAEQVVRLVAHELDCSADTAFARFEVATADETIGNQSVTRRSVIRRDGAATLAVLDLYPFKYRNVLLDRVNSSSVLVRTVILGAMLVDGFPRLFRCLFVPRTGNPPRHLLQLLIMCLIFGLMVAYMGVLLTSLVQLAGQTVQAVTTGSGDWSLTLPQAVTIVTSSLITLFPGISRALAEAAGYFLSVALYLQFSGGSRNEILGLLDEYLEAIAERSDVEEIQIWSYSFGSMIALDALFPRNEPSRRRYSEVRRLITIGSIFDFIRLLWPKYYTSRYQARNCLEWINIYAPADALGCSFGHLKTPRRVAAGITVRGRTDPAQPQVNHEHNPGISLTLTSLLLLTGLRAHMSYWSDKSFAQSCFGPIVRHLYAGRPPLG